MAMLIRPTVTQRETRLETAVTLAQRMHSGTANGGEGTPRGHVRE